MSVRFTKTWLQKYYSYNDWLCTNNTINDNESFIFTHTRTVRNTILTKDYQTGFNYKLFYVKILLVVITYNNPYHVFKILIILIST